jgi:hypothetical protein
MKFVNSVLALGGLAAVSAQSCNADNCLRAMRGAERIEAARAFCGTFTTAAVTATAAIPTFAVEACTGSVVSRVSSACSCIATTAPVSTTTVRINHSLH